MTRTTSVISRIVVVGYIIEGLRMGIFPTGSFSRENGLLPGVNLHIAPHIDRPAPVIVTAVFDGFFRMNCALAFRPILTSRALEQW